VGTEPIADIGAGGSSGPAPLAVAECARIEVPAAGRVLVASDLHLLTRPTPASDWLTRELVAELEGWIGPGVVVLNGDVLELLAGDPPASQVLAAHSRLTAALRTFASLPGRSVLYLVGNHDSRLGWDETAARQVGKALGATLAFAAELSIETGEGTRRVRVEHGNAFDRANRLVEPRNPRETPLGHHVVQELLPAMRQADQPWLAGVDQLANPSDFPGFVASRLVYRRLARHLGWLALPFLLALVARAPLVALLLRGRAGAAAWPRIATAVGFALVVDAILVITALALAARRAWAGVRALGITARRGRAQNDTARAEGRRLVGEGWAGLITGHTHQAELTSLGGGFYANTGCSTEIVTGQPARLGLPDAYLSERQLNWVILEGGARLRARLVHARVDGPTGTLLERIAVRPSRDGGPEPVVVATAPEGEPWPVEHDPVLAARRARRLAAAGLAAVGLLDLLSALTPPVRDRLRGLVEVLPLEIPQAAAVAAALSGIALLFLAGGVRRGQRRAWTIACAVLGASMVAHLAKGADVEEALVSALALAFLLRSGSAFRAATHPSSSWRGLAAVVGGFVATIVLGVVAVEATARPRPSLVLAARAVVERTVGLSSVALPHRVDRFLVPVLPAVTVALALVAGWVLFRPVVARRAAPGTLTRARSVVDRYGRDTLAYFALRADKQQFFAGESLVAYGVFGGVCLVSPDPVGPETERDLVWEEFRRFADGHGWALAVLGASEDWLPVYQRGGLRTLYVGDEAIVDCSRFTLEGSRMKSLRQAVNRIVRGGYHVEFYDPATVDPGVADSLRALMAESRRGEDERGFSMTLGRIFDPEDRGLLLSVAWGSDGQPAAMCQFVPAPGIGGFSLDLMRRSTGEHPNGLIDFVIVETIRHLAAAGHQGLALNFATMRAVLADERGGGVGQRVQRWVLEQMSESMQIESLWHFNAKYDPQWRARYAAYDTPENLLAAATAVARAEAVTELPFIGRLLRPAQTVPGGPPSQQQGPHQ
jgi:lysylphosphatidylglycerol synthetase-like protein (DUF2156 family)/UDP-2,3-diacylglucosamine pyrophosphatase LpxH